MNIPSFNGRMYIILEVFITVTINNFAVVVSYKENISFMTTNMIKMSKPTLIYGGYRLSNNYKLFFFMV